MKDLLHLTAQVDPAADTRSKRGLGDEALPVWTQATGCVDVEREAALNRFLVGDHGDDRRRIFDLLGELEYERARPETLDAQRAHVVRACQALADAGVGTWVGADRDGRLDAAQSLAVLEAVAAFDLGLYLKVAVTLGFASAAIASLGTSRHHVEYLPKLATMERCGCYAMTEVAHGSNVRGLETTATYDPDAGEFVVDTPHAAATKHLMGNGAEHADFAIVFAQLVAGGQARGVFGLIVPLVDEHGHLRPGIERGDVGVKAGLNGMDNGWLRFAGVRIPRHNLLNRFGDVDESGHYRGYVANPTHALLSTMVEGRLATATAALGAAKTGLATAVRYAVRRRQFGPRRGPQQTLMSYPAHRARLIPHLARAYAAHVAMAQLVRRFGHGGAATKGLDVECLALKAFITSFCAEALQVCRECCGGQGYLAVNRIGLLRADVDGLITLEGDNTLLRLQIGKQLLQNEHARLKREGITYLGRELAGRLLSRQMRGGPFERRRTNEAHLGDGRTQLGLLRYRERSVLASVGRRMGRTMARSGSWNAFVDHQLDLLELADAYIDRLLVQRLDEAVDSCGSDPVARLLESVRSVVALATLESRQAWYLRQRIVHPTKARAISALLHKRIRQVADDAPLLVDAFGLSDDCLGPIAFGDGLGHYQTSATAAADARRA